MLLLFRCVCLPVQARLHAVTEMEDLVKEVPTSGVGLRLEKMERYLHGPTAAAASCYASGEDVMTAFHNVSNQMEAWQSHSAMVRGIMCVCVCVCVCACVRVCDVSVCMCQHNNNCLNNHCLL